MNVNVAGKVVVITGASRGLGRELAGIFAREQAKVAINYCRSESQAHQLFEDVSVFNHECMLIRADVTSRQDVSNVLYHSVMERYGHIDVLINNAGICEDNSIEAMSEAQWGEVIDVDLTGVFQCCQVFSAAMIKQRHGKIINISSLKGQEGAERQANYSVAKAGVIALTKSLAKELGRYNIAVNAVCPGFIVTDLNRGVPAKRKCAEQRSLLQIDSNMNDFMNAVVFLSSDRLCGVSGQVFNIDSRI